jgi:tripartite-type tricarboxylate transporter receptor subunit TctC
MAASVTFAAKALLVGNELNVRECVRETAMNTLHRRRFLHLAAGAATLPAVSRTATAQAWPSRPVTLIVGFAPGGAADIVARLIGQWLMERLGQPFIIENRPGASSNIATEAVVRAVPDGHTFLVATSSNAVNATLYDKLSFNFIREIAPVAGVVSAPNFMVLGPTVPAKTVPEFITYAKSNPGKVNFASGGIGTSVHMCGELFRIMAGIDMVHVPYRGEASGLADMLGRQMQVMFPTATGSIEYIRAGRLRVLAVTTAGRSDALPDVPTVGEFLPGYEASGWTGIGAPKNTPSDIIDKLNTAFNAALADAKIKARLADLSSVPVPLTPADFGKLIAEETDKWEKVIRTANVKPG